MTPDPIRELQRALWQAEEDLAAARARIGELESFIVVQASEIAVWKDARSARMGRARPRRHDDQSRYAAAIRSAQARGKPWGLDRSAYEALVAQPCRYCGGPIASTGVGLDRLDNSQGYEPGNVSPCCGPCNMTRGDRLTPEEMEAAMSAVRSVRVHAGE